MSLQVRQHQIIAFLKKKVAAVCIQVVPFRTDPTPISQDSSVPLCGVKLDEGFFSNPRSKDSALFLPFFVFFLPVLNEVIQ